MSNRFLAGLGAACVAACLALFAYLHFAPVSSGVDWERRTLSQYALLENGWAFDAAVLLLAAGSAAILLALIRAGVFRARSGAAVALGMWVAGLVGVVLFEKHNWSVGPSMSGDIHRAASLLAFLSLPVAAVLAARPWLRRETGFAVAVLLGGVLAMICFAPILYGLVSEPWTGVRWWRAIPLGTVERLLGLAEVATVLLMGWWAAARPAVAAAPAMAGRPAPQ